MTSDLESRLRETLRSVGADAAVPSDLSGGARARLRRRRTTVAVVGAVAVGLIALPLALKFDGSTATEGAPVATDVPTTSAPSATAPTVPADWRAETWHDVTFQVPNTWGSGGVVDWCANGHAEPGTPGVSRPDTLVLLIGCTPPHGYGATVANSGAFDPEYESGHVWQYDAQAAEQPIYPDGAWLGYVYDDEYVVTVATPDQSMSRKILDSVHRLDGEPDPNGCSATWADAMQGSGVIGLSMCRYDSDDLLASSRHFAGPAADGVWTTLTSGGVKKSVAGGSTASSVWGRWMILKDGVYAGTAVVDGHPQDLGVLVGGVAYRLRADQRGFFAQLG